VDSKDKESSRGLGKAPPLQQHSQQLFFKLNCPGALFWMLKLYEMMIVLDEKPFFFLGPLSFPKDNIRI
jgi:hypothetical protein